MVGTVSSSHESGQVCDYFNQQIVPEVTLCDFSVDRPEKSLLLPPSSVGTTFIVAEASCHASLSTLMTLCW